MRGHTSIFSLALGGSPYESHAGVYFGEQVQSISVHNALDFWYSLHTFLSKSVNKDLVLRVSYYAQS